MDKTLFNVHDLVLLLTSFEAFIFAFIILSNKNFTKQTYYIFAALLLSYSLISLHEIILWGTTFRHWVLELSPNIFFLFNFSYWLDAPLLYLLIKSLYSASFTLSKKQSIHFIPVFLFIVYLFFAFWLLDSSEKVTLINSYDIAYSWHYVLVDLFGKSLRIYYVIMALLLIKKCNSSNNSSINIRTPWVKYLLLMLLTVNIWECILTSIKVYGLNNSINLDVLEVIGLASYYATFSLLNLTIYIVVIESINKGTLKPANPTKKVEPVNMAFVEQIEQSMKEDKLYRNPNLSFERFSEQVNIPVKDLSYTINRYFDVNFYEYVNKYRIIEAKESLECPENNAKSITVIFLDAGFNSKSVYNTLFKKMYNVTPSQYRKNLIIHDD